MSGPSTRTIHAGVPEGAQGEPLLPGPTLAAPFHLRGDADAAPYGYGRDHNPTWTHLETALGELDGGESVVFPSGMAAVTAVLMTTLRAGDVLVGCGDGYPGLRALAADPLEGLGVEVRLVSTPEISGAIEGAKLVWIETPSNPKLDLLDIAALASATHAAGAKLAVDNTVATPLGQQPLALGADFAMLSGTKSLTGHSDMLLGNVSVGDPELARRLVDWRTHSGSILGGFEAWLAHRSLATLDVRLERQAATALALAEALATRDDVTGVRYPGLPGDAAHEVAARQMSRFGSIVVFDVGSRGRADRFLAECSLVADATSFGGVHSSAERRARWPGNEVGEGFIRLSVGIETTADLIADVEHALERTKP
jgi:cystathionine gamma-lyase